MIFFMGLSILRSIPNKLGGVLAMFGAILILFVLPFINSHIRRGNAFYPLRQILFWFFLSVCILLTWIGGCPVEAPYDFLGQVFTFIYFLYFAINPISV